jgi:lysophospholipase L1-like esterase
MKTVLCFGDSNTFGTLPMSGPDDVRRLGPGERWPGILRARLGHSLAVVEEGLPGRTTVFDDPVEGENRNGRRLLAALIESHWPLDAVIVMLGTNDLKARFGVPPSDIARGAEILLELIRSHPRLSSPEILLICPPPILEAGWLSEMFTGGAAKSRRLPGFYASAAARCRARLLDAGTVISPSPVDGVHYEADQHRLLGEAVCEILGPMLGIEPR